MGLKIMRQHAKIQIPCNTGAVPKREGVGPWVCSVPVARSVLSQMMWLRISMLIIKGRSSFSWSYLFSYIQTYSLQILQPIIAFVPGQNNSTLSACAPTPKSSFGETRLAAVHCSHYLCRRVLVSVYKFSFILQKHNDAVTLYYANIVKKGFGAV